MASPFLLRLARGAALLFAVSVLALLISCAHQSAQKPAAATETTPNEPVVALADFVKRPEESNFIPSSKSGDFLVLPAKKTMKPVQHKKP